jgi:ferredoxin
MTSSLSASLRHRRLCKIIAGLGFRDQERVRRLAALYAAAGADLLDVALDPDVVTAALEGARLGQRWAAAEGREVPLPVIMVSLGLDDDPHVGAALLDVSLCATCAGCTIVPLRTCAARPLEARAPECPQCLQCIGQCPHGAITLAPPVQAETLRACLAAGATAVELHVGGAPVSRIRTLIDALGGLLEGVTLSLSTGACVTDPALLAEHVALADALPQQPVVLQIEGTPMSNAPRDGRSELPAIELAREVLAQQPRSWVQLAGGTGLMTGALCGVLGVPVHGIAFGTAARLAVSPALAHPSFEPDQPVVTAGLFAARALVQSTAEGAQVNL